MTMMEHKHNESVIGMVLGIVGLMIFAVLIYELFMNRSWVARHIPEEVRKAIPEPVTKALEGQA